MRGAKMSIRTVKLIIIVPALIFSVACAEEGLIDGQNKGKGGDKGDLNLNKAYLQLFYSKEDIRGIRSKSEVIDKELEGTAELSESFKPLEKTIQTVDKIYLHPKRSVTVILPSGSQITRVTPTFDMKFLEFDESHPSNIFTLLSMPAFVSGDITVYYTMGTKNYVMKLVCEKYTQTKDSSQSYHAVIAYKETISIDPFTVMEAYKKEFGSYPAHKYSFITLNSVVYKIIEDQQYGKLTAPNGKKYRVDTQVNQRD